MKHSWSRAGNKGNNKPQYRCTVFCFDGHYWFSCSLHCFCITSLKKWWCSKYCWRNHCVFSELCSWSVWKHGQEPIVSLVALCSRLRCQAPVLEGRCPATSTVPLINTAKRLTRLLSVQSGFTDSCLWSRYLLLDVEIIGGWRRGMFFNFLSPEQIYLRVIFIAFLI